MRSKGVWVGQIERAAAATAMRVALDAVNLPQRRSWVVIKVNLCDYRRAETGATTDPVLLGALIVALRERWPGVRVTIVENEASSLEVWSAYRLLGIEEVARTHDAELANVAEGAWMMQDVPDHVHFPQIEVPSILRECDFYINFAKLKTNALTKFTGCLKNTFAFLRQKRKVVLHGHIDAVLEDMNKVIVPDLCLIDGCLAMEGIGGPAFGRPKRLGLLVAGTNAVATDSCAARIAGFRPRGIEHIRRCAAAGLGSMEYEMKTDVPDFRYERYGLKFETWEYLLRNALRRRAGFST